MVYRQKWNEIDPNIGPKKNNGKTHKSFAQFLKDREKNQWTPAETEERYNRHYVSDTLEKYVEQEIKNNAGIILKIAATEVNMDSQKINFSIVGNGTGTLIKNPKGKGFAILTAYHVIAPKDDEKEIYYQFFIPDYKAIKATYIDLLETLNNEIGKSEVISNEKDLKSQLIKLEAEVEAAEQEKNRSGALSVGKTNTIEEKRNLMEKSKEAFNLWNKKRNERDKLEEIIREKKKILPSAKTLVSEGDFNKILDKNPALDNIIFINEIIFRGTDNLDPKPMFVESKGWGKESKVYQEAFDEKSFLESKKKQFPMDEKKASTQYENYIKAFEGSTQYRKEDWKIKEGFADNDIVLCQITRILSKEYEKTILESSLTLKGFENQVAFSNFVNNPSKKDFFYTYGYPKKKDSLYKGIFTKSSTKALIKYQESFLLPKGLEDTSGFFFYHTNAYEGASGSAILLINTNDISHNPLIYIIGVHVSGYPEFRYKGNETSPKLSAIGIFLHKEADMPQKPLSHNTLKYATRDVSPSEEKLKKRKKEIGYQLFSDLVENIIRKGEW